MVPEINSGIQEITEIPALAPKTLSIMFMNLREWARLDEPRPIIMTLPLDMTCPWEVRSHLVGPQAPDETILLFAPHGGPGLSLEYSSLAYTRR